MLVGILIVGTFKCWDRSPDEELFMFFKQLVNQVVMVRLKKARGSIPLPTTAPWCSGSTGGSNPPGPGSTRWWGDQYNKYNITWF